jgi:hypothetical protein
VAEKETYRFEGLDLASPAVEAPPGACRTLDGLVRGDRTRGWSPAPTASATGAGSGALSLGRQSQRTQNRILALTESDITAIDPASAFSETTVHTFGAGDATRRASFATVANDTAVAVTAGSGHGTPEKIVMLRDDTDLEFPWPRTPLFSVEFREREGRDYLPQGQYAFRLAYVLDDGTVGPASGPLLKSTPTFDDESVRFDAKLTIDSFPASVPAEWADRIAGTTVIVHPEASVDATRVKALDVPGFRVSGFDGVPDAGDSLTYSDSVEGIVSGEIYVQSTMAHHTPSAGAAFAYNKRLILGDVAYDLERPHLDEMVGAGSGSDYHLLMRVQIQTSQGKLTRYSEPIGFTTQEATSVALRTRSIFYRDPRAVSWRFLVSTDYAGSVSGATWEVMTVPGAAQTFDSPEGTSIAVVEAPDEINLRQTSSATTDITSGFAAGDLDHEEESQNGQLTINETEPTGINDFSLASGETVESATFRLKIDIQTDTTGQSSTAEASAEISYAVLDSSSNVLEEGTWALEPPPGGDVDAFVTIRTLDDFPGDEADKIRVQPKATASTTGTATAYALAEVVSVTLEIATTSSGDSASPSLSANDVRDYDPNRIIWSEPLRPLDLPPENVVYAGGSDQDQVLAITSVGQPVSSGQFGDYPLIVLGAESMRLLQVGAGEVFVENVVPVTTDLGIAGRRAWANLSGTIAVATERGVYEMTPQLGEELSTPLHDPEGSWLSNLGADTALGYYTDSQQGRQELWVTQPAETYVLTVAGGAWSTLPIERSGFVRLGEQLYGIGTLEIEQEGAGGSTLSITIETAPSGLGAPLYLKRMRDVWLLQATPLDSGTLRLDARAPTRTELDTTTDIQELMRLSQGLGRAYSIQLSGNGPSDAALLGFGVRYSVRAPHHPQPLQIDE